MSDTNIVMDHLRAALLATPKESTFLTYLIQMALIEGAAIPEDCGVKDAVESKNEAAMKADTYAFVTDAKYTTNAYAS